VRHAHKNLSPDVPIDIEVKVSPHRLEIRIWDRGATFDLEKKLQEIRQRGDTLEGSGRGLIILRKIADELSYTRTDDSRNCLLIVKYY
jgi:serine/threonine-protein kinase RsbW